MAKLKAWYNVVTPREDLLENRPLDASEFAVHLDHIRTGRSTVSKDYLEPERFFERTYVTKSLEELASQVVRRLSGIQVETSAVFNMATQFGGGKTHSLAALYHLATHGERANSWKGVNKILERAQVASVPKAAVAVFVGTEFDALTGRGGNGGPTRRTPWGEIAWQLGNGNRALFDKVAEHDAKCIAPAGDVIRQMLPSGPTLILMDELMNYVSTGRKAGMRDQFYNFLQNLCEEARARNNMALCISIPRSDLEMNPDDQRDHDAIKKLCDRLGKEILMSADQEMGEIIRRRLFEWHGLPDEGRNTVNEYAEWATEHAQELSGFDADNARARFQAAYPFHPNVLSVFERKWQGLPRFQRTRGVLRLLALWVANNCQPANWKTTQEPLITLGLAPFDNQNFRSALFAQLGDDKLEIPVTTDILGKSDAHSVKLDKEADEEIKKQQLHRKVATVIFFESNGGQLQAQAEASLPEIRAGIGGPDVNLVNTDTVLESLASNCFYLNWDRNRYRFGLSPNLNQILVNRKGAVRDKDIADRVNQEIQILFERDKKDNKDTNPYKELDRKFFPSRSNDIANRPMLTLVVLGTEHSFEDKKSNELMNSIVQNCGATGRTFKSALIFAVPDAADQVHEAARNLLAWEDIEDDEDTKNRIDEGQKNLLRRNLANAKRDLSEAIFRIYRHTYLLGKDNQLRHVDLGRITSSSGSSIVELIVQELDRIGEVTTGVSASKLVRNWPGAMTAWSTKSVRDAFFSSPQLERLLKADSVKSAICNGVTEGLIGYASKDANGQLKLEKLKESLFDADVEISDEMFILRADDAQKLREPPRLARLVLNHSNVGIAIGEQVAFQCSAHDQYGQQFPQPTIKWTATGGQISAEGLYTAGAVAGLHAVKADGGGLEAIGEVRIRPAGEAAPAGEGAGSAPAGKRLIRWRGTVPPQKWMNFYTKLLTRFASNPDLRLEVSFEVPLESAEVRAKVEETKAGLKELGLSDDVEVT